MVDVFHASASFGIGSAGVDIFFIISGFIMVHTTYASLGRLGPILFLKRRIARVVPLYWLCSAVPAAHHEVPIKSIVGSLLFIPIRNDDGVIQTVLQTGWTLNFEMFFYVIFAVCLMLPRRLVYPGIFAALSILILAGIASHPTTAALIYWTNPLLIEFMFGMGIALAYERGVRLSRPAGICAISLGFLVLFVFWLNNYQAPDRVYAWSLSLLWGVPSALIVGGAALSDRRAPATWLWPPVLLLGNASYSIYLSHLIVFRLIRFAGPDIDGLPPVVHVIAAIIIGVFTYIVIEKPIARTLAPMLREKPRPVPKPMIA
jgi:exopolysaccharide production protein ExoZ